MGGKQQIHVCIHMRNFSLDHTDIHNPENSDVKIFCDSFYFCNTCLPPNLELLNLLNVRDRERNIKMHIPVGIMLHEVLVNRLWRKYEDTLERYEIPGEGCCSNIWGGKLRAVWRLNQKWQRNASSFPPLLKIFYGWNFVCLNHPSSGRGSVLFFVLFSF